MMCMSDKDEPAAKDIAAVIPEVYFDLISRVPAGAFVLLLLGTDSKFPWQLDFKNFGASALLLFLGGAYGLGLVIAGLAVAPRIWYRHLAWRRRLASAQIGEATRNRLQRYLTLRGNSEAATHIVTLTTVGWTAIWRIDEIVSEARRLLHDDMKACSADGKTILPKMSAEAAFFSNIQFAVAVVVVAKIVFARQTVVLTPPEWLWLALFAELFLAYGAYRREAALRDRELSYLQQFLAINATPAADPAAVGDGTDKKTSEKTSRGS
jgi:hypothetical protein